MIWMKDQTSFRYAFNQTKEGIIVEYDYPTTIIDVSELKIRMLQLFRFFEGINSFARDCPEIETY